MDDADNRWERFAAEDAELYIWTPPGAAAGEVDLARFFETGREEIAVIMRRLEPHLGGYDRAVEIGAGVGRLAVPMAAHFTELLAVDVSPTMVEKLVANCRASGVGNVGTALLGEPWDEGPPADLVYCWAVFQHVEAMRDIEAILRRASRVLKPGTGLAYLHFDTRPRAPLYRLRKVLPDAVLPRMQRRGIRRIRRNPAAVRSMLPRAGFDVLDEWDPGGPAHVYLARRP